MVADNTINSFKVVSQKQLLPTQSSSGRFRCVAEDALQRQKPWRTVSILQSKAVLSFADLAKKYGQTGESKLDEHLLQYEGAQIDGDNLKFISAVNNTGV